MTSSSKKKKEKAKDFQKSKLKVGKARPTNANATNTSFSAKSIVLKQQSLTEASRSPAFLFAHNLSLLNSKSDTQRKDALQALITAVTTSEGEQFSQPASIVLARAQPLILDGNKSVREHLIKLLYLLPADQLGSLDQLLLFVRAGMAHLSTEIRMTALDVLDWLLTKTPAAVMSCPGSWIKTLRTFQNLLSWTAGSGNPTLTKNGNWTATKTSSNLGGTKLIVHELATLAKFLTCGLVLPPPDSFVNARLIAADYPLSQLALHAVCRKSRPYAYLNLFDTSRDVESEVYESPEERAEAFTTVGLRACFIVGVSEIKKEGGEIGRAAAGVIKALKLIADD